MLREVIGNQFGNHGQELHVLFAFTMFCPHRCRGSQQIHCKAPEMLDVSERKYVFLRDCDVARLCQEVVLAPVNSLGPAPRGQINHGLLLQAKLRDPLVVVAIHSVPCGSFP